MATDTKSPHGFVLPPPLPGDWVVLSGEMASVILARLDECGFAGLDLSRGALIRVLPLSFWDGWVLCDVQPAASNEAEAGHAAADETASGKSGGIRRGVSAEAGQPEAGLAEPPHPAVHSFVYGPDGFMPLDGGSSLLHQHNARHGIYLVPVEDQHAYLRFFCYFVRGESGPFQILEAADDVAFDDNSNPGIEIAPLSQAKGAAATAADGALVHEATVLYGGTLFKARFALQKTGMIEMLDDDPVCQGVSAVPKLRYSGTARMPEPVAEGAK